VERNQGTLKNEPQDKRQLRILGKHAKISSFAVHSPSSWLLKAHRCRE
jgi:hypothetical protein